jgi:hypothetical protein
VTRRFDDTGSVGGAEVLPLAVLTFVVGSLLVANLWAVVDARLAVDGAARAALRTYAEAPDASSATRLAPGAAREAVAGAGRDPTRLDLRVTHPDGRAWGGCVPVEVTARYPVPVRGLPGLGPGRTVTVEARHRELVDPWRSGVADQGGCR